MNRMGINTQQINSFMYVNTLNGHVVEQSLFITTE